MNINKRISYKDRDEFSMLIFKKELIDVSLDDLDSYIQEEYLRNRDKLCEEMYSLLIFFGNTDSSILKDLYIKSYKSVTYPDVSSIVNNLQYHLYIKSNVFKSILNIKSREFDIESLNKYNLHDYFENYIINKVRIKKIKKIKSRL